MKVNKDKLAAVLDKMLYTISDKMPIRIQVMVRHTLTAEVIVEPHMQYRTWAAFANKKYDKGLPIGGACMQRADLKRMWDVPVGSQISK